MDTVQRIKELEPKAEKTTAIGSKLHWEVAQLYWTAIEKEGITKASLARQVGKSAMHVLYMYRCWDRIVVKTGLVYDEDYGNLPSFYPTYNSAEVRGDSDQNEDVSDTGGSKRKHGHGEEPADYTTHGLVEAAAKAVNTLAQNKAHWPLLSEDDLTVLRAIPPTIRALLRDSSR